MICGLGLGRRECTNHARKPIAECIPMREIVVEVPEAYDDHVARRRYDDHLAFVALGRESVGQ